MLRLRHANESPAKSSLRCLTRPMRLAAPTAAQASKLTLQSDVERRGIARRVLHRIEQQLAAAIAKNEIVGVARSERRPSRGVRVRSA